MKNTLSVTKLHLSIFSALLLISVLLILPLHVSAESVVTCSYSKKGNAESNTHTEYSYSSKKMVSVKSSDPSIATASFKNYPRGEGYTTVVSVKFKKAGSVTVTELREGETAESSFICKAVNYKAPLKTLKFGKKDYSKKIANSYAFTGKPFTGKVTFKTRKGWKFVKMYKFKVKELTGQGMVNQVQLKKNSKIKIKKGDRLIIQLSKGKDIQSIRYTAK